MRDLTKSKIAATVIASSVLLSGCGLFGGDPAVEEIDPPQDVTYTNEDIDTTESGTDGSTEMGDDASVETVTRELYLVDKNGMVVPQSLQLPKTEGVAKQVLEYLVEGGPVTEMLPNGFRAVLPQDTQVTTNMEGNTVIVDFSKEFANYQPEDELRILQSITYTLTQFDPIKNVKIRINGHDQDEMPVNGTPIGNGLNRSAGINLDNSEVVDITNTKAITLYFLAENQEGIYYVPVTKRIDKSETDEDNIAVIVKELIEGPDYNSSLLSDFQTDAALLSATYEDGKVTLDFNENIYGSFEEKMISRHVINSLVLSLTEQPGIESVAITVVGNPEVMTDEGKTLTEPVTRPEKVNTGSF